MDRPDAKLPLSKGGRAPLQGPWPELRTKETEGQILQRVMTRLMGVKEAARVWIAGLEAVQRKLGLQGAIDLSATPFFLRGSGYREGLRGSGYREGMLFPWTASDFLADGCHRVRHREAAARAGGRQHPGRRDAEVPQRVGVHPPEDAEAGLRQRDALSLPVELQTALKALRGLGIPFNFPAELLPIVRRRAKRCWLGRSRQGAGIRVSGTHPPHDRLTVRRRGLSVMM